MIKVFGIKTCGSVRKALKFFKDNSIEVEFIDLKKEQPSCEEIDFWSSQVGIDKLFNSRGTKYRNLKLKELNLDDNGKREWLCKEPMLFKRPVIEIDSKSAIVAFDEELYKELFIK